MHIDHVLYMQTISHWIFIQNVHNVLLSHSQIIRVIFGTSKALKLILSQAIFMIVCSRRSLYLQF